MPNPQFTKPWHGIQRDAIHWNPTVIENVCTGCGTCVTGCSRLVYRFDYDRHKPVVVDPLNCMVGCTTCANTCPVHAIVFPPIEPVLALERSAPVRRAVKDDLVARREVLAAAEALPHPDRIVTLAVSAVEPLGADVLRVRLVPTTPGECFCEFTPGQYLEIWQSGAQYMSRAYMIANTADGDGTVELHLRRIEGGRFSGWAFSTMKVGDAVQARGPLGQFTMRSLPETPLLFVAGGTGLAPVLSLLRQQARFHATRDMVLVWGAKHAEDLCALDDVRRLLDDAPNLSVTLAVDTGEPSQKHERMSVVRGSVLDAINSDRTLLEGRDIYAAGPPAMVRHLALELDRAGVAKDRVHLDSFGV